MKIRKGFVSNSSTSSFICEICGREEMGMDLSLDECEMFECENGHTMCQEHAIKDLTSGGKTEEEIDDEDADEDGRYNEFDLYEIDESCCPICTYQEISYTDAASYLLKRYKVPRELVFEKVKAINKRRKKLYDEEYVKYVFEQEGLNDDTFLETIKTLFPSYKDYKHYQND